MFLLHKNLKIITYKFLKRYTISKILKKIKGKEIVYSLTRYSFAQLLFAFTALVCGITVEHYNQETKW